jgi:hypothetical protein
MDNREPSALSTSQAIPPTGSRHTAASHRIASRGPLFMMTHSEHHGRVMVIPWGRNTPALTRPSTA